MNVVRVAFKTAARYSIRATAIFILLNAALAIILGYSYAYLMDSFRWVSGGEILISVSLAVGFGAFLFRTALGKAICSVILLFIDVAFTFFGMILFFGEAL